MFISGKHKACLFDAVVRSHGVKTGRQGKSHSGMINISSESRIAAINSAASM